MHHLEVDSKSGKTEVIFPRKSLKMDLVVVQLLSSVRLFVTPWTVACQAPLSSTISRSLLKFMSIESVMLPISSISSFPQSFPASRSYPMNQLFTSGGQSIGASALVLKINNQNSFPLGLTGSFSLNPRDSHG